jgi:hypothetical protein
MRSMAWTDVDGHRLPGHLGEGALIAGRGHVIVPPSLSAIQSSTQGANL